MQPEKGERERRGKGTGERTIRRERGTGVWAKKDIGDERRGVQGGNESARVETETERGRGEDRRHGLRTEGGPCPTNWGGRGGCSTGGTSVGLVTNPSTSGHTAGSSARDGTRASRYPKGRHRGRLRVGATEGLGRGGRHRSTIRGPSLPRTTRTHPRFTQGGSRPWEDLDPVNGEGPPEPENRPRRGDTSRSKRTPPSHHGTPVDRRRCRVGDSWSPTRVSRTGRRRTKVSCTNR